MNAFVPLLITLLIQSFSVLSMILPLFSGLHELPIMRTSCLAARLEASRPTHETPSIDEPLGA